jgi:hypothetical protein
MRKYEYMYSLLHEFITMAIHKLIWWKQTLLICRLTGCTLLLLPAQRQALSSTHTSIVQFQFSVVSDHGLGHKYDTILVSLLTTQNCC